MPGCAFAHKVLEATVALIEQAGRRTDHLIGVRVPPAGDDPLDEGLLLGGEPA